MRARAVQVPAASASGVVMGCMADARAAMPGVAGGPFLPWPWLVFVVVCVVVVVPVAFVVALLCALTCWWLWWLVYDVYG